MLFQSKLPTKTGDIAFSVNTNINYTKARRIYDLDNEYNWLTFEETARRLDLIGNPNKRIRLFSAPIGLIKFNGRKYDLVVVGRHSWKICLFKHYDDGILFCHAMTELFNEQLNHHRVFDIFDVDPDNQWSISLTALVKNFVDDYMYDEEFPAYLRLPHIIEESAMIFMKEY